MSEQATSRVPTERKLHDKSSILSITFDDGKAFELPCEYLRVFSKTAEVQALGRPVHRQGGRHMDRLKPQGRYAVRIVFDDGHDTGIYSWDTPCDLGVNQQAN